MMGTPHKTILMAPPQAVHPAQAPRPLWVKSRHVQRKRACPLLWAKRIRSVTAFRLAAEAVQCVIRTRHHIKTGRCSPRRVAHLRMAAAWHRQAADHGASNLLLWSSVRLRVALVLSCCVGRHKCKCKHNGNDGYDCFHRGPSLRSFSRSRLSATEASFRQCRAAIKRSRRSSGGISPARSSHFFCIGLISVSI